VQLSPDGSRLLSGEERRRNRINLRAKRGMSHGPHAVYGLAAIRSQARRVRTASALRERTWWAHAGGGNALVFKQPT
jgi:hypothetical protein